MRIKDAIHSLRMKNLDYARGYIDGYIQGFIEGCARSADKHSFHEIASNHRLLNDFLFRNGQPVELCGMTHSNLVDIIRSADKKFSGCQLWEEGDLRKKLCALAA